MDGQEARTLHPGEAVKIHVSRWPVPCVERWASTEVATVSVYESSAIKAHDHEASGWVEDPRERGRMLLNVREDTGQDEWVRDINTLLQFNAAFRNKAQLRHSQI